MSTKTLPGKITISRPIDSHAASEYISITIQDRLSHNRVVEVRVPLDNFSKALTGQGYLDCELKYPDQSRIGKKNEVKKEFVPFHEYNPTEEQLTSALEPFEVDGWKGRRGDLTNHHKYAVKDGDVKGQWVVFERYVETQEEDLQELYRSFEGPISLKE